MKTLLTIIVLLALLAVGLVFQNIFTQRGYGVPTAIQTEIAQPVSTYVFQCVGGKSVAAAFDLEEDNVELSLSDGRNITLPHVLSASGARYANEDDSFVFWNKGNTAFVTESGTETFSNCVTA